MLRGELRLPGDSAISHRGLILGAMAEGRTFLDNLSGGEDVLMTANCLSALGVEVSLDAGRAAVKGSCWRGLEAPRRGLDVGGSAETLHLMMGVLSGSDVMATLDGDESLRLQPAAWVALPLRLMGAEIRLKGGQNAPVSLSGSALQGIDYASPVAGDRVKSAVLLAGLLAIGETSVTERSLSRDHTERLLGVFGARIRREGLKVTVSGGLHLGGAVVVVPGDPTLAAYWAVAATVAAGSEVRLLDVSLNPTRLGFVSVLRRMGADIEAAEKGGEAEPRGDLLVRSAALHGVDTSAAEAPALLDEIPFLALAASLAKGASRFSGLAELRRRQNDQLAALVRLLGELGGEARLEEDDLIVTGLRKPRAASVSAGGDPRLAMTALLASQLADGRVDVQDERCVETLYPLFFKDLRKLGGKT